MNSWKKIFTLSLVAFQMSTFAISNTAHAADDVITLADLHNSKYDLNSNTKLSFGKLYSAPSDTSSKKYSLMTDDNGGHWIDVADGHSRPVVSPTSINDGMEFNPETSPWQNEAVYVDFSLTGDDTAVLEKSAHRCYDAKVVGGNSDIEYQDQMVKIKKTVDYTTNVMQDLIVSTNTSDKSWDYYQHGDGWGYGEYREDNGIYDGQWGTDLEVSNELEEYYEDVVHEDDDPDDYKPIDELSNSKIKSLYRGVANISDKTHAKTKNGYKLKFLPTLSQL